MFNRQAPWAGKPKVTFTRAPSKQAKLFAYFVTLGENSSNSPSSRSVPSHLVFLFTLSYTAGTHSLNTASAPSVPIAQNLFNYTYIAPECPAAQHEPPPLPPPLSEPKHTFLVCVSLFRPLSFPAQCWGKDRWGSAPGSRLGCGMGCYVVRRRLNLPAEPKIGKTAWAVREFAGKRAEPFAATMVPQQ